MLNKLRLRLRALFFKSKMEDELQAELQFHIEREIEENIIRGMTPEEARCAAIRSFGGVERVKEESREARGVRLLEEVWQDLRYGARMLRKQPGFTLVVVVTLALGIGANTVIFSVVNAVLLRPLPYSQPERVIAIWDSRGKPSPTQGATLPRNFQWWREQSRSFSDFALTQGIGYRLTETQEATSGAGLEVTPNLFSLLGVSALRGRTLAPGDETAGAKPVVLSHRLWQSSFGGDESVIGRSIKLGAEAYTVVGIMPPQFVFPPRVSLASDVKARDCDLWVPLAIDQQRLQQTGRNYFT
jgi:putative ABC transport system permease protein